MPEDEAQLDSFVFNPQTALGTGTSDLRLHGENEGESSELSSLLEVSKALSADSRVKLRLHDALKIMERQHGAFRSMITLFAEGAHELHIAASVGLSADGQRVQYRIGEGITGRVVETGKPVVIPQVSREPMFLNRAGRRRYSSSREITFVCVPILIHQKAAGSLSVDLPFEQGPRLRPRSEILWRGRFDDRASRQDQSSDRRGTPAIAGRKRPSAGGASGALRLLESDRQ